mgnify:CR=1 FL=1
MKNEFFYQIRQRANSELRLLRFDLDPEPNSPFIEIGHNWFQVSQFDVFDESFVHNRHDMKFCWKRGLIPKLAPETTPQQIFEYFAKNHS